MIKKKKSQKIGIEETYLNIIKAIYNKPIPHANNMHESHNVEHQEMASPHCIQYHFLSIGIMN